jgi:hypothetical protein
MTVPTLPASKAAADLKPGDWIAAGKYTDRLDGTDDAEVLHIYKYAVQGRSGSASLVAALVQERTIPEPIVIYLACQQMVPMLSAAEIADIRQDARRAQLVAQLREIADLIQMNEIRLPEQWGAVLALDFGGDTDAVAEVAKAIGTEVLTPGAQVETVWPRDANSDEQVLVSWVARGPKVLPAEPVEDERCGTCGESLREIELGTLGHIPGEACAPAEVHTAEVYFSEAYREAFRLMRRDSPGHRSSPESRTAAALDLLHGQAIDEDAERTRRADVREGEQGRVTNPNVAHFLAVKEERSRTARHFLGLEESAKHNAAPVACSPECAARPEEWPCLDSCPAQVAARAAADAS